MNKLGILVSILFYCIFCFNAAGQDSTHVIDISSQKQLFIDDLLIESCRGISKTMNLPHQYDEILLECDQPWEAGPESKVAAYSSVLKEKNKIRLWYDLYNSKTKERCVAYAESDDGLHFKKPKLGLINVNGSRENNLVIPGTIGGCSVWIDRHAPENERYKTQAKIYPSQEFQIHTSADGLNWKSFAKPNIGNKDTQTIIFWDSAVSRYVMYTRKWFKFENKDDNFRCVRRLESDDLVNWDNEMIVMEPDSLDRALYKTPTGQLPVDYYGALVFKYPNDQGMYMMLAQTFWHWFGRQPLNRLGPNAIDVRLAASRDGKKFSFSGNRMPFLNLGREDSFYSKMVWALPNPVIMDDEIWIYFAGSNQDHAGYLDPTVKSFKSGIGRAVLRLDGFVSIDADFQGGEIITPLLKFMGKNLELNMQTSGGGCVRVEILDEKNQPIDGFQLSEAVPLCGNSVRMPVKWEQTDDVSCLSGKTIKLRFVIKACKLYAFQFKQ